MKDSKTYIKLTVYGGLIGLHKYYMEEYGKGIIYSLTFGLFMFGWIADMIKLVHANGDVDRYNAKRGYLDTKSRS